MRERFSGNSLSQNGQDSIDGFGTTKVDDDVVSKHFSALIADGEELGVCHGRVVAMYIPLSIVLPNVYVKLLLLGLRFPNDFPV